MRGAFTSMPCAAVIRIRTDRVSRWGLPCIFPPHGASDAMECPNCGATIPDGSPRCGYCNTAVAAAPVPSAEMPLSQIFEHIRHSPVFARASTAERQASLPNFSGIEKALPIAFGVIFMLGSLVILGGFCTVGGLIGRNFGGPAGVLPLLFAVVPLGFVIFGALMVAYFVRKFREFDDSPVLARPAVVAGKRTEVSGGGENRTARTTYHVTCEFEDGRREEFQAMRPELYSQVSDDDAGVLFTRGNFALDFDRIRIET